MSKPADYEISLEIAKGWTENWQKRNPDVKAFLIPTEDLMGVLVEMGVLKSEGKNQFSYHEGNQRDVRGYLGLDDNATPHMVMVGTKKFPDSRFPSGVVYRDLYNGGVDGKPGSLADNGGSGGSGVFDFSQPCPNVCDDQSELNGVG